MDLHSFDFFESSHRSLRFSSVICLFWRALLQLHHIKLHALHAQYQHFREGRGPAGWEDDIVVEDMKSRLYGGEKPGVAAHSPRPLSFMTSVVCSCGKSALEGPQERSSRSTSTTSVSSSPGRHSPLLRRGLRRRPLPFPRPGARRHCGSRPQTSSASHRVRHDRCTCRGVACRCAASYSRPAREVA